MMNIRSAFVIVVGCGGVGSYVAVHLARSGVGRIRLIDFDQVTLSSLNRHATATRADVGVPKVVAIQTYLKQIVPHCQVETLVELCNEEQMQGQLSGSPMFVIDCIDNIDTKVDLLHYCLSNNIPVVSSMGSALKVDPSRIQMCPLSETSSDGLAKNVRLKLKRKGSTALDKIMVIYSTEVPQVAMCDLPTDNIEEVNQYSNLPQFRVRILPVISPIPAMFGAGLAAYVLSQISRSVMFEPMAHKHRHALYANVHRDYALKDKDLKFSLYETGYLIDEVYQGKSVVSSECYGKLALVKWDPSKEAVPSNLILLTSKEAKLHAAGQLEFDEQTLSKIQQKLKLISL